MSYPTAVKGIEVRTHHERRIINEENFIKLIRLIIVPMCLLLWYCIYKCCQLLHHWIFL